MAVVHLPRSLVDLFPGAPRRLQLEAGSVLEVLAALDRRWPGMLDRLCHPGPEVREHINLYVDGDRAQLDTALAPGSILRIIPAVSGGSPTE